jgi:hypothetical protein
MNSRSPLQGFASSFLLVVSVGIFTLGSALDIYTTTAIINSPTLTEANPIVAFLYDVSGVSGFVVLKLVIGATVFVAFRRPETNRYLISGFLTIGVFWFVAAVWNAYMLLAQT